MFGVINVKQGAGMFHNDCAWLNNCSIDRSKPQPKRRWHEPLCWGIFLIRDFRPTQCRRFRDRETHPRRAIFYGTFQRLLTKVNWLILILSLSDRLLPNRVGRWT
jgi:hypothetical protein